MDTRGSQCRMRIVMGMLLGGRLGAGASSSTPLLESSELDISILRFVYVLEKTNYVRKTRTIVKQLKALKSTATELRAELKSNASRILARRLPPLFRVQQEQAKALARLPQMQNQ